MFTRYHALVIPHDAQRYNTVGDYYSPYKDTLELRISDLKNTDYEFLVLIHELVEAYLCYRDGISDAQITSYDIAHASEDGEPGDNLDAPYHNQHVLASSIEYQTASALGVNWSAYSIAIDHLSEAGQGPDPEQEMEPMSDGSTSGTVS